MGGASGGVWEGGGGGGGRGWDRTDVGDWMDPGGGLCCMAV